MSLQLETATATLRSLLLDGEFAPGRRLKEVEVSQKLNSSRTIARLAMSALEAEGLLVREANRGTRARTFSIAEIAAAIEVRGEMEAMAARLAAERGISAGAKAVLDDCLKEAEALLAGGVATEAARADWIAMNGRLHDTLIAGSGNWAIAVAVKHMSALPLVSASSIIFDRLRPRAGLDQLRLTHLDHVAIRDAVVAGEGSRAGALMREHAFRSASNKRRNLSDPETFERARNMPGAALIVAAEPPAGG